MFKTLWPYLRGYKKELILGPAFKFTEAVIETVLPFLIALVIDNGVNQDDRGYVVRMTALMLVLVTLGVIFAFSCQYMSSLCSQGFGTQLRQAMMRKITRSPQSELQSYGQSSLLIRATVDINQLQLATAMTIRLVSRAPFLTIGSLVMGFVLKPKLALLMLIAVPLAGLALFLVMKATVRVYKIVQQRLDKVTQLIRDNLSGSKVIRAFAREGHERWYFAKKNAALAKDSIFSGKIAALMNPVTAIIFNAVIILVLWRGGLLVEAGELTQGEVVAFIAYQTQLVNAMMVIAVLFTQFPRAFTSGKRLAEVLASEPEAHEAKRALRESDEILALDHVGFTYPTATVPALENIRFKLKKGERLGVIGATGSGKSTLAALILRLYEINEGEIQFEGVPTVALEAVSLRARIAYVPQKAALLTGSVRSNLLLGRQNQAIQDEQLWEALRIAQAEDFVKAKEGGLDALVERGGANFSGGQKQRLCLARALLGDFDLLILDDATSALDYLTDYRFRNALQPLIRDKAALFISQRIHVVKNADQILVLDDGEQIALGTHEELLETCAIYQEIASSQLERGEA